MGMKEDCSEFARNGGTVYVFNANTVRQPKEKEPGYEVDPRKIGPVAIMSLVEYSERHRAAQLSGDPTMMFADPTEYESFTEGEMEALADYIDHPDGLPECLNDGQIVTAFESRKTLRPLQETVVLQVD